MEGADEAARLELRVAALEGELREALERAREAQEARRHFVAAVSHELRTPLNTILGFSELLLEEATRDGLSTARRLAKIHDAGRSLLGLVNDLLDVSRTEGTSPDLHLVDTDPLAVAREALSLQRSHAEERGNRLVLDAPDGMGMVRTDAVKLRRALVHVLSNAVRFTHEGTVALALASDGDEVTFTVTDTGVGMTEAELQALTRPFPLGDLEPFRTHGGAGLGLALADRLCALLGGSLALQSAPGKGTTATLRVPALAPRESVPARVSTPEPGPRGTALVVDDDGCAREILAAMLTHEGYGVRAAATGPEALELLRTLRPSLLTVDLLLPGGDAWSVLSTLQADPALREVPVLVVSALEVPSLRRTRGVRRSLLKPVDRAELSAALRSLTEEVR
ncbi:MAG: response regulator [Deltaproteobacteria bacterium]|nr:response regulator [Deltaproteobacteria bacterium]